MENHPEKHVKDAIHNNQSSHCGLILITTLTTTSIPIISISIWVITWTAAYQNMFARTTYHIFVDSFIANNAAKKIRSKKGHVKWWYIGQFKPHIMHLQLQSELSRKKRHIFSSFLHGLHLKQLCLYEWYLFEQPGVNEHCTYPDKNLGLHIRF